MREYIMSQVSTQKIASLLAESDINLASLKEDIKSVSKYKTVDELKEACESLANDISTWKQNSKSIDQIDKNYVVRKSNFYSDSSAFKVLDVVEYKGNRYVLADFDLPGNGSLRIDKPDLVSIEESCRFLVDEELTKIELTKNETKEWIGE